MLQIRLISGVGSKHAKRSLSHVLETMPQASDGFVCGFLLKNDVHIKVSTVFANGAFRVLQKSRSEMLDCENAAPILVSYRTCGEPDPHTN